MPHERELLDIEQAAAFLGVSATSLRRWTNAGRLRCLRIGGRRERRFRREDLLAFLHEESSRDGRRPASTAAAPSTRTAPPTGDEHSLTTGSPHLCGLYGSDLGRIRLAVAFIADGLASDGVCWLLGPAPVRDSILRHLAERRPSLPADLEAGRLVPADHAVSAAAQYQYWERQLGAAERDGRGTRPLRVVSDLWAFSRRIAGNDVATYEADYDRHFARRFRVTTLCLYDVRRFSGHETLAALKGHPDSFGQPPERWLA